MTDAADARTPNRRLELGARSRDEILNAALATMAVYGYEGTSISRIATESGLPASSIYWHFSSKAGVLAAVMERGAERFFTSEPPVEQPGAAPRELFRQRMRAAGRAASENPEFLRLLFLLVLGGVPDDDTAAHVRSVIERGKRELHATIEFVYATHGAEIARAVADRTVDFAQGAFDGAFIATQTHDEVVHAQLIEQFADAVLAVGDVELRRVLAA